jgi:ribosomal protein L29
MAESKNKSEKELIKELADKREALLKFRFGASGSKSKNVKEGRQLRKEIAQILTALNANKA